MADIYDQHRTAFANCEAHVILHNGERVATIAFKFPRDGAGRLYAYVHWIGLEMVRGFASGGGYDKRTAACAAAVRRIDAPSRDDPASKGFQHSTYAKFRTALHFDAGPTWDRALRDAGFTVLQAV